MVSFPEWVSDRLNLTAELAEMGALEGVKS